MSAAEMKTTVHRVLDDLSKAQMSLSDARLLVVNSRLALKRLETTNLDVTNTLTILANTERQIADDSSALLQGHDYLTNYWFSL